MTVQPGSRDGLAGRLTIRPVQPADVGEVLAMVRELAEYERALHEVIATEDHLHRTLFAESPAVFAHVAEAADGRLQFLFSAVFVFQKS